MTDYAMALNCPSTKGKYKPYQINNIKSWLDFFILEKEMHVITTLPLKRKGDITHLEYDKDLYTLNPVRGFDTCNRWSAGLDEALNKYQPRKNVYLWSADFEFSEEAKIAANKLLECNTNADLVVGTIEADGKKEDIDRCATCPLIKTWFPEEYEKIKSKGFLKPRSELLRFSVPFLKYALDERWFPTEQTIHLIFQCLWSQHQFQALPIPFSKIKDDGKAREQPDVIQQVERMEVWLKYMWRDRQNELKRNWWETREYAEKCIESFSIIMSAQDMLLLGKTNNRRRKRRK